MPKKRLGLDAASLEKECQRPTAATATGAGCAKKAAGRIQLLLVMRLFSSRSF